ncbi:LamG-like jellyroll fold domain-containing protein [Nonomuraea sp. NPDC049129]|uniref:LamG-like jellyroll fold domain-containing protein n=1 Tax=Nonomuraea sp. NPDC049129 TaxID=3155272 RepID=UPI0033CEDD61
MTPKQLTGGTGLLPTLVEPDATSATGPVRATTGERPKGALPLERRPAEQAAEDTDERALPGGVARAERLDAACCAPLIEDMFPLDFALVGTRTPLLVVYATSDNGIDYSFKVCRDASMLAGCSSSAVLSDVNTWRVPAGKLAWGKQYYWQVTATDRGTLVETESEVNTFTTGVKQPVVGSQLAARGVNGQEFHQLDGNYTTTFADASVATAGPPLSVVRTYNTLDARVDGMFGAGWSTRWDMRIVQETGALLVTWPNGQILRFAANGDGTFQSPPGMHAALAAQTGGGWRLMDQSSTSYVFDAAGRVLKVRDGRGRTQDLAYGTDGKLASATATGGRSLRFGWTGNHVTTVSTDPVDGAALTWSYQYDGDRLTASCSPVAAPNCTQYGYGSGSAYRPRVLDSDPYGYWRLNEATGTDAANLGWGAGPATYNDPTLRQPGALAGTADASVGFTFGGLATGGIQLRPNVVGRLAGQASVEVWFKTTQPGVVFSAGEMGSSSSAIYVGTDGKLRAQFRAHGLDVDDWYTPITSSATVTNGQWHHVVLTAENGTDRLYLDGQSVGVLQSVRDEAWQPVAQFAGGQLGFRWPVASTGFRGQLDEAAIYDRPLTEAEIQSHYAARLEAPNKLTKVTLPSGRVWADNTYDAATDRIKTHTDQHGGTWQIGEPVIDSAEGTSTIEVTDPNGKKITSVHSVWRGGRLVSVTDQVGGETSYDYDTGGFLAQVIDPNDNVTTLANDERGNPISGKTCRTSTVDCQIAYATYYLNKNDEFDPRNDRVLTNRDARSSSSTDNTYVTTWEYNQYGESTKQTSPATSDFPNGRSIGMSFTDGTEAAIGGGATPAGLVASQIDARGYAWTYRYTAAGDLAEQTNPEGLLVKLAYDGLGRVREKFEVSQAYPDGVKTTFTYDGVGRPLTQTDPGVKNEVSGVTHTKRATFAYDPDGNKLSDTLTDLTGGDAERVIGYTYDTHAKLETTTDPEGGVVRQTWNAIGQLATITDARGALVEYGYDARGLLTSRTLKGWTGSPVNPQPAKDEVLESFTYDPGGRLETQTDAMRRTTFYSYFKDNLLEKKTAVGALLNDSTTTTSDVVLENHTYDAAGNQIKLVSGGDKSITTNSVYDAAGRLTSQTFDPTSLARKTAFVYDANGNVLKTTRTGAGSTRAEVTEYAYNKVNQVTKTTVENGDQDLVSTTTYDDRGLAVASTDPRGNVTGANAADFTSTMRYDALGRLIEVSGPQVKVDKAGTSSDVHPTAHFGYDTLGVKTHETDAEGRTVTSVFDKAGRLTSQSAPSYTPPGGTAVTPTTSNTYDTAGQLITTTDPRGYVTTFEYDKLGRQVRITDPAPDGQTPGRSIIEYYMDGAKKATVDPTGARTEATYDGLGRQITQTQIERKPATAAYITNLFYNQADFLIKTVAPGNKTIDYTPNAAGEVVTQIAAKGTATATTTTMGYDLAGRLIKTADDRGNSTTVEYDLAGRQIGTKELEGTTVRRTTSAGYDPVGNQTSVTSGEGHTTRQTFDALNRATSLIEPISATDSITTSFGYDATGARTRLTDGRGNATWTTYNSLALAETVTEPATIAHPDPADRTWTTGYDAAGNPNVVIQPGGVRIDRTFDHLGRLTKESGAGGGAATAERTFGYDLADRPTTIGDLTVDYNDRTLPLSIKRGTTQLTGYAYDGLGNPTQRVDAAGTATFTWDANNRAETASDPVTGRKLTYGYDAANNLASLTAKTGTTTVDTQVFTYDYADRLETQTLRKGAASGTQLAKITYGWDKDDNLTTKTTAGLAGAGTNTYGYDQAGRLTSWTAPGGATTAYEWDKSGNRTKAGAKTYTYDERNRLTSGDGTDYTYTPRGTLATETKAGATTNYTFDAFDRLIADGDSLYSYDALDRISSRIKGAVKQNFAYAGLSNDLAALTDSSGAIQAKYGRDAGGTLLGQQEGTNPALATLSDLHGDLVATYSTTALATTTAYDPFGTVTAQTGVKTTLGYQGEYTDPDTGKVNMHARWYQPGTGNFTSRDTATLTPNPSVQANRYTYANASPLTGTDPTGHASVTTSGFGSISDTPSYVGLPVSGVAGTPYGPVRDNYEIGDMCAWASNCVSGGGYICAGNICSETFVHQQWWNEYVTSPGYDYEHLPLASDEEIKRLGYRVMPNGRAVPKDIESQFWKASAAVQNAFMAAYSPAFDDKQLLAAWIGALMMNAGTMAGGKGIPRNPCKFGESKAQSASCYMSPAHKMLKDAARKYEKYNQGAPEWGFSDWSAWQLKENWDKLNNFKRGWVRHYREVIKGAAAFYAIPAIVLGGIALIEVGKKWETLEKIAEEIRAAAPNTIIKGGRWLDTSLGAMNVSIRVAAVALGYDPNKLKAVQARLVLDALADPVLSIFIAAKHIAAYRDSYMQGKKEPVTDAQWTQAWTNIANVYNPGYVHNGQRYGYWVMASRIEVGKLLAP